MCGIAGLWDPSLVASDRVALASRMGDRIRHRGPDDAGVFAGASHPVVLAHRRLAIQGLGEQGRQPMLHEATNCALIYNGELFGCDPLRLELVRRGHVLRGTSDTEVLLHALVEWGVPEALDRIRGQFAFAFFDGRDGRLHFARDRVGIRPFYFAQSSNRFAFASEQKSLFLLPWVDRSPHRAQLLRYLALGRTDDVPFDTMLEGIRSLPPGHHGTWDGAELRIVRYARVSDTPSATTIGEVAAHLERAVDEQLVGDVPVGAMVSGGLDSSSVALLADRARSKRGVTEPFHLFLYHDARAEADERPFQRAVLSAMKSPHSVHWVSSSPSEFADAFDDYIDHQEEPYGDVSSYAEYVIAREARAVGVKVLLSGLGGDEVFLGYPSFIGPTVLELLEKGDHVALRGLLQSVSAITGRGRRAQLEVAGAAGYYLLPARLRNALTAARAGASAALAAREIWQAARDGYTTYHPYDGAARTNAALRSSIESWCVPRYLLHSDRVCLAWGVEGRVPLLDDRLIEAAFGIPVGARVGSVGLKATLREAARSVLPTEVTERRWKLGFHAPLTPYVDAVAPRLIAGLSKAAEALGTTPPDWDRLPSALRWRWGVLGTYLGWTQRAGL